MTDPEPRQLLPKAESHQNLSSKPSAARPLPPRSRSSKASHPIAKSPRPHSEASDVGPLAYAEKDMEPSHEVLASAESQDEQHADLEASGTASPVRMTVQRAVSGSSVQSIRSNGAVTTEIPQEEIETALRGLDRSDLVVALGRAKVQMDEIEAQLDEQILENETLHDSAATLTQQLGRTEAEVHTLQSLVKQREERIDEMMADQERMEGEVYSTMQVIERLRKQLAETERGRNDAEKRYLDQTATMDKERQYYIDTEALLKSQKATQASAYDKLLSSHNELLREHERLTNRLASIRAGGGTFGAESGPVDAPALAADQGEASPDPQSGTQDGSGKEEPSVGRGASQHQTLQSGSNTATLAEEKDTAALIEELATLQRSHSSLSETMVTLQTELKDVRAENATLRDQNETFMDILQEKTFSGALLNESAMLRGIRRASLGRLRAQDGLDDPYEDEYSTEADSLDSPNHDDEDDDRAAATSVSSATIPEEDEDDVDDVPDTPKAPPQQVRGARRRRADSNVRLHATTDLASELERTNDEATASPDDKSGRDRRASQRVGIVSDRVDELQKEVRELREANQALTLYISKIIDRIIAREGYENILAVESQGTTRGPRHKASRARLGQSSSHPKPASEEKAAPRTASNSSNASHVSGSSQSSGLFGFGAGGSGQSSSGAHGDPRAAVPPKSKRTASIDWRNLPFLGGGTSVHTGAEPSSHLRPLTLQSDSLLIPPSEGSARKLRTSEEIEDEHDVAERERIRHELLERGIQPPIHQLVQSPNHPRKQRPQSISAAPGAGGFAAFFSRVVGGASSSAVLSPGSRSDAPSQASTTPGRSSDTGFERFTSSTPAAGSEKRDEERTRALQLSAGSGSSLTKLSGGPGIASKARQLRAERNQQTLDLAADTNSSYPFPTSSHSSTSNSRDTSGSSSIAESSLLENSVAGDESYSLPAPPGSGGGGGRLGREEADGVDSPLTGYGGMLPPLPHETTGDEEPQAFQSPALLQSKAMPQTSQDQGWKRAFRRISLLSTTSSGSQPGTSGLDSNEPNTVADAVASDTRRGPLAAPNPLSTPEADADK